MTAQAGANRFDVIVLGAGPGGEAAVTALTRRGMKVALVERELVGGECAYWACMPSKTLLRVPEVRSEAKRTAGTCEPEQRWAAVADYRDYMIRHLDDSGEIESYERDGVRVFKGAGAFDGPGRIAVDGEVLESERIVIATGSETRVPSLPGLQEAGYWTNREATTFSEVPDSAVVLGGGPVGIELAQLLRRFGAGVCLVESADRLLSREDPRVSELILDSLRADGVEVFLGAEASAVHRSNGRRLVEIAGGRQVGGAELIVAIGRQPRVDGLALERAGIDPGKAGIEVDERCRAGDGIWAIGDVTGAMPFTHTAKYQARIAAADIAGEPAHADYSAIPRVVFCDPEVAAVGMSFEEAKSHGIEAVSAHVELPATIARPWTYETEPRGELAIIADPERRILIGAWAVAPLASEWIHHAALAIKAQIPLAVLRDTVAQFPTYTEAYLKALERLDA